MIDLWCYRKNGHNEQDEAELHPAGDVPARSPPKPPSREIYAKQLIAEDAVTDRELDQAMKTECLRSGSTRPCNAARSPSPPPLPCRILRRRLERLHPRRQRLVRRHQGLRRRPPQSRRRRHPRSRRFHRPSQAQKPCSTRRLEMSLGKAPIDWGGAEMLALGSLLLEGTPIRFVGQDAQRGTFTHRHAALRDYNTGDKYVPLANICRTPGPDHHRQHHALRAGRPRLRIWLQLRRPAKSRRLGSPVRRFRQHGPADHRSVHRRRRIQMAENVRPRACSSPTATKAPAPNIPTPISTASSSSAPRTTSRSSIPAPRRNISTSFAGRCTASSASR